MTTSTVSDGGGEYTPDGYLEQWKYLQALGVDVVGIRDTPRWMRDPVDCLWANSDDMALCSVSRSQSLAQLDPASQRSDLPSNVTLIDVNGRICVSDTCPAVLGDTVVYWDLSHLSATFARSLASDIGDRLPRAYR